MAIQQYMCLIKATFCIVLVLNFVAACGIEEKKETQEQFLGQVLHEEDTAEVLWITCLEDLIHLKKECVDNGLCLPQDSPSSIDEIRSENGSIATENIQKLISTCHPELKEKFLQCLRKTNVQFPVSGEEGESKNWNGDSIGSLSSRRHLGNVLHQHLSEKLNEADDGDPKSKNKSSDNTDHEAAIKQAIVVTALVTFLGAALLFFCFCRVCGGGQVNQFDERPLLSLSMSDYSIGSASNSNLLRNSSLKEDKLGFQSPSNRLDNDMNMSIKEHHLAGGVASDAVRPSFDLKPPPGSARQSLDLPPPPGSARQSLDLKPPPGSARQSLDLKPPPGSARQSLDLKPPPGSARSSLDLKPPPGKLVTGMSFLKPPTGRPDPPPPEPPSVKPLDNANAPPPPPPGAKAPPPPPGAKAPPPPPGAKAPPPPPGARAPPPPPGGGNGPRPPPPPGGRTGGPGAPPPPMGAPRGGPPPPFGKRGAKPPGGEGDAQSNKAKLKPFFWDKVQANSDQTMVWGQLKAGSFQFNEEMMETLFGYNPPPGDKGKAAQKKEEPPPQFVQIIDKKKAQNLSILLKALNITLDEVCDALLEGNELPAEFIQTLLKMAPTSEEELKLRLYAGSLTMLGPADRFLKALVEIPFAFKRMEALLYMSTLQEELTATRDAFSILEVGCKELRSSRLFLKLLEAVLKTGNRMNDGTFRGGALAFKLDTLLKLSDVKGVDGKTTLLHFVVQEIIRTEGIRSARMAKESLSFSSIKTDDLLEDVTLDSEDHYRELGLQVVSSLSSGLENVKKAAALDADGLTGTTARLGHGLIKTRDFVKEMDSLENDKGFHETVKSFVQKAEADVTGLLEEEKKIMALVKSTGDYFHGSAGRDEGLRLFGIVRDFLIMLDKVCKEIQQKAPKKAPPAAAAKAIKQDTPSSKGPSSPDVRPTPPDTRPPPPRLVPAVPNRTVDDFSSDDDSP